MLLPGNTEGTPMMVGSKDAMKGCIIDPESIKLQDERYAKEKGAVAQLDTCVAEKNLAPVLLLILDEAADRKNRERAADLLVELNDLSCVDPIRNHTFRNEVLAHKINLDIIQLLKKNYKKECPDCSEIIKAQSKKCQHCGKEF
jgi:Zn finger protein HypA/HybF involved in hydrogenase expression